MRKHFCRTVLFALSVIHVAALASAADDNATGERLSPIQPYAKNPWYWQYQGEPILLRGGSDEDNPFQWTGETLTDHLELLVSVGGNYLRNTMSSRDEGNVYAFERLEDGLYDLDQWNEEFWNRLEFFLQETAKRGIIVQLTLWDKFDYGRGDDPWQGKHNVNYAEGVIDGRNDFYRTLKEDNQKGLAYQHRYIDKLLATTFAYDHVLYNIDNESSAGAIWETYWANYIHQAARKMDREAYVTTMQFDPSDSVRTAMTFPDLYNYIEISQNNQDSRGGRGTAHWDNIMSWRDKLAYSPLGPMPMNNEKIYGATDSSTNYSAGTETEAINRFWRNVFGGCASARFHRPSSPTKLWGSGLNERVQTNLKAMNLLLSEFDLFSAAPHNDLLRHVAASSPSVMEAYVVAHVGNQYAVYFPRGRYSVGLDPWIYVKKVKVRWLDVEGLTWSKPEIVDVQWEGSHDDWGHRGEIVLKTPGNQSYVALIDVVHDDSLVDMDLLN